MAQISLVLALFVVGLYLGVYLRDRQLLYDQFQISARAHFQNIVLTRMWNARHSGVFVEKKKGVETNPYLENPEFTTTDGRVFTKRNPAMMTREISELAEKHGLFQYSITSLKPLNPDNGPDDFERAALREFERSVPESFLEENRDGKYFFRYMAPPQGDAQLLGMSCKTRLYGGRYPGRYQRDL